MTPRQRRFIEEYLLEPNATQAAIRAGYNPTNADVTGPRMLGNVGIQAEILKAQNHRTERVEITADLILQELYTNVGLARLAEDFRASNQALELCQKHVGVSEHHTVHYTPEQREEKVRSILERAQERQQQALVS